MQVESIEVHPWFPLVTNAIHSILNLRQQSNSIHHILDLFSGSKPIQSTPSLIFSYVTGSIHAAEMFFILIGVHLSINPLSM